MQAEARKESQNNEGMGCKRMGWFYGFKLHIVINDKGEIIKYKITSGNVDDRAPLKDETFTKKLFGKLIGDRGNISQSLFDKLFIDDIPLASTNKNQIQVENAGVFPHLSTIFDQ